MTAETMNLPENGETISLDTDGTLLVPQQPIIPFFKGNDTDLWAATQSTLDAAVQQAYAGERRIAWSQVYDEPTKQSPEALATNFSQSTLTAFSAQPVALYNTLASSACSNDLHQQFGCNVVVQAVQHFAGLPCPVQRPQDVHMVFFSTHDELNSPETVERLLQAAITYALQHQRKSITLVHQDNALENDLIRAAYAFVQAEFSALAVEDEAGYVLPDGLRLQSCLAGTAYQQVLRQASDFDVVITLGLASRHLADVCVAQVGGMTAAAHHHIETAHTIFMPSHLMHQQGSNPMPLMFAGALMLRHLGWQEAAELVLQGMEGAIAAKTVTADLAAVIDGAVRLSTAEFGSAVMDHMDDAIEEESDVESDQYDALADKFHEIFDTSAEKTADFAQAALEKSREQLTLAGRFTEAQGHKLKTFMENDFPHVAQDLKVGAKEKLNPSRLGAGALASMSKLLHLTGVALSKVADKADGALACKSGEITSAGSLQCHACGYAMNFKKTGRIPPCPKCHKTTFSKGY